MDVRPQGAGPGNDIASPLGELRHGAQDAGSEQATAGPSLVAEGWRTGLGILGVASLLVMVALMIVNSAVTPSAEAVQPYAPRGITAQPVASADWFALSVRASGFRPNSTVLVEVEGLPQRSMVADAAGVVDARVELPDTIGVSVRGVALEGGSLQLSQEVGLVRPDGTVRNGLILLLAVLAVAAVAFGPRIRSRFAVASATAVEGGRS